MEQPTDLPAAGQPPRSGVSGDFQHNNLGPGSSKAAKTGAVVTARTLRSAGRTALCRLRGALQGTGVRIVLLDVRQAVLHRVHLEAHRNDSMHEWEETMSNRRSTRVA